jgi:hypothetical protein
LAKTADQLHAERLEDPEAGLAGLAVEIAERHPAANSSIEAATAAAAAADPSSAAAYADGAQQEHWQLDEQQQGGAAADVAAAAATPVAASVLEPQHAVQSATGVLQASADEPATLGQEAASAAAAATTLAAELAVVDEAATPAAHAALAVVAAAAAGDNSDLWLNSSGGQPVGKPPKQPLVGSKRKQEIATGAEEAATTNVQQGDAGAAVAAAAATCVVPETTPGSVNNHSKRPSNAGEQAQAQLPQQPVIADVPIVLAAGAKRRRTAGPGGPGRRGGSGPRAPAAAAAAGSMVTQPGAAADHHEAGEAGTHISALGVAANVHLQPTSVTAGQPAGPPVPPNAAQKVVSTNPGANEVLAGLHQQQQQQGAPLEQQQHQQQLPGCSGAVASSRKRSRPEPNCSKAGVAVGVDAQVAMLQASAGTATTAHNTLPAPASNGPSSVMQVPAAAAANGVAADAATDRQQQQKRQWPAEHKEMPIAAATSEQQTSGGATSSAATAAAATAKAATAKAASTTASTEAAAAAEAAVAGKRPPDKPDSGPERARRRSTKELRMLSTGIAGGSLEPAGPRSRRGSRDGGPSVKDASAGGATSTSVDALALQQLEQQHGASVEISDALLQAFPMPDVPACKEQGGSDVVLGAPSDVAQAAAADGIDGVDAVHEDIASPASAAHQRHQQHHGQQHQQKKSRVACAGKAS